MTLAFKGILVGTKTTREQYESDMIGYTGRSFDEAKALIPADGGITKETFGSYTTAEIKRAGYPNIIIVVKAKEQE